MTELILKWEKFGLSGGLHSMLRCRELLDVSFVCEGEVLQAHKSIVAACSSHFKRVFMANPCQHPIVIMQDVKLRHLRALIDFMYTGQAKVRESEVKRFMRTAEALKISGLHAKSDGNENQDSDNLFEDLFDGDDSSTSQPQPQNMGSHQPQQPETLQVEPKISLNHQPYVHAVANWMGSQTVGTAHGISYRHVPSKPASEEPKNKQYRCTQCSAGVFGTEHNLQKHIRITHTAPNDISCDFCNQIFQSHYILEQHVEQEHLSRTADNRYQCTLCERNYKTKKQLLKHKKYKHDNVTENVSCTICSRKFTYMATLRCHMRKKHNQYCRPRFITKQPTSNTTTTSVHPIPPPNITNEHTLTTDLHNWSNV